MRHAEVVVLGIGHEYTRDQIHQRFGGSKQSYLPTKQGVVVAACLTQAMNPRAPEVILCGRGKLIERAGAQLAGQSAAIPVFLKRGVNRWEYRGTFAVSSALTSGAIFNDEISKTSRRASDISRVVLMRRVGD
jgi:hypothetical protein